MSRSLPRSARRISTLVTAAALVALVLGGCGKQEEELTLIPVSGKVTVGNTVLPTGQISFVPDAEKGNKSAKSPFAMINADGTYTLSTGVEGAVKEGAPPGWYRVTINAAPSADPAVGKMKVPTYNSDYGSAKNTPLSVEVRPDAPAKSYDLKLRP
jgi:hypothetical protein